MKTDADPTGLARNRRKAVKRFDERISAAKKRVMALFRAIPFEVRKEKVVKNKEGQFTSYDMTAEQADRLRKEIKRIMNDELLESQSDDPAQQWWFKQDIESVYRKGTLEETNDYNQLIALGIILGLAGRFGMPPQMVPPETVVMSSGYAAALNRSYVRGFNNVAGISNKSSKQLVDVISDGTQAGLTQGEISRQISERISVAKSDAKRVADTEINESFNVAKTDTIENLNDQTGLTAGVIHISALTSTTRDHHADRHGNAYTVSDQNAWWAEGANRINCLCTVKSVLIGADGKVVDASR